LLSVQPRLGFVLEGGYHLEALAQSVVAVLHVLVDPANVTGYARNSDGDTLHPRSVIDEARQNITEVQRIHAL
jgi:acetoin utilization deacetylase AcuC-like enzyme